MNGLRKNRIQKHLDVSRILDGSKSRLREGLHPKDMGADYNWNMKAPVLRGIVPEELCLEIIRAVEG